MNHPEVETAPVGQQPVPADKMQLKEHIESALSMFPKVFLMYFELRFPLDTSPPDSDKIAEAFLNSLAGQFGPNGLDLARAPVWLRAQDGGRPMYHCALLLNGDKLERACGAQVFVQEAWNLALGLPREPNVGLASPGVVLGDGVMHGTFAMLWPSGNQF